MSGVAKISLSLEVEGSTFEVSFADESQIGALADIVTGIIATARREKARQRLLQNGATGMVQGGSLGQMASLAGQASGRQGLSGL